MAVKRAKKARKKRSTEQCAVYAKLYKLIKQHGKAKVVIKHRNGNEYGTRIIYANGYSKINYHNNWQRGRKKNYSESCFMEDAVYGVTSKAKDGKGVMRITLLDILDQMYNHDKNCYEIKEIKCGPYYRDIYEVK